MLPRASWIDSPTAATGVPEIVAAKFPAGANSLYAVDPLGNLVLSWPAEPDIKGIASDLTRLLKASRIG